MISVKQAAEKAADFAVGVLDEPRRSNLRLEEVEKQGPRWLITLSMPSNHPLGDLVQNRDYKTFTIDGDTGEVVSMKIRQLASTS